MAPTLKDQVLALGGDERDLKLITDAGGGTTQRGSQDVDPDLTKDVSNFLRDLKGEGKQSSVKKDRFKDKPRQQQKEAKNSSVQGDGKKDTKKDKTRKHELPAQKADVRERGEKNNKPRKTQGDVKNSNVVARDGKQSKREVDKVQEIQKQSKKADAESESFKLQSSSKSLIEPTPHWYTIHSPLPPADSLAPASPAQLTSLTTRASTLLSSLPTSSSGSTSASDASFLQKVLQSGTLSDKLSALTLLVQGSPVHNMKALETLKGMAAKGGGRDERLKACRCIVDWWVGGGAPDRKLKYFRDQPLLHPLATDTHLLLWYFEDWLKKYFFSFLQILESLTLDPLPYVRIQSLSFVFTLLRDKAEQEQNLLRLLVNKLGDSTKQVPSRASHYILRLLQAHPAMKPIVVREMSALIFRPSTSSSSSLSTPSASSSSTHVRFSDNTPGKGSGGKTTERRTGTTIAHAIYYSTITLNQVVLISSGADRAVAKQLIDLYFQMFEDIVGLGAHDEAPPDNDDADGEEEKGKGKHKHKGKWKGKGKENSGRKGTDTDAGFVELEDSNSKLVSQILTGVNRALPYARLELGDVSFTNHIDTLFRITHTATFPTSLQALVLLLQITTSFSSSHSSSLSASQSKLAESIADRFYRTLYSTLLDPRLASTSKHAMYLNLLLKALKLEKDGNGNNERVKGIARRLAQVLVTGGISGSGEVVVGGLWVLAELFSTIPGLKSMIKDSPGPPSSKDGNVDEGASYDPRKRDPRYANASASPMWELLPLRNHYHPTISLHARQLLSSKPVTSSPDLSLNSLGHFLDRFVYKNPKKIKTSQEEGAEENEVGLGKGGSVMQPAAVDGTGVRKIKGQGVSDGDMVREEGWWRRGVDRVPVDQIFFHKYFNEKDNKEKSRAVKKGKRKALIGEGDDSDGDLGFDEGEERRVGSEYESDADEKEIWKAMKASMQNLREVDDTELVEDSDDEIPSGLDDDSEDDEDSAIGEDDSNLEDGDEDTFSMAEGSEADDLVDLDAYVPEDLVTYDGSDSESRSEWGGIAGTSSKKRKREGNEKGGKKKLRSLPTFASYEDYSKMIEDGPEDNV